MEVMPGYKQTEVGAIPEDWVINRLIECADYVDYRGKTPTKTSSGILLVTAKNIRAGFIDYEVSQEYIAESEYESAMRRGKPCIGDVLITTEAPLGMVALVDRDDIALAQRVIKYRGKSNKVYSEYLKFYFLSSKFQALLDENSSGSTAKGIKGSVLHQLPVILPPLPEQEAIAEVLSKADALIECLERLIAKKLLLKRGVMQKLLNGRRRLREFANATTGYKQTGVGVIPEDWYVAPLGELISSLDAGVSINSVDREKDVFAHEESILKTSCVLGGKFFPEEHKKIIPRDVQRAKLNPRADTIIISRMNTPALVGECGYVSRDYPNLFLPDRLWITRFDGSKPSNARWLAYLLSFSSFNRVIKESATGTSGSMKNISKDSLLSVQIPLPSKAEQDVIAEVLSAMDAEIALLEAQLAKYRQLKQGLMQKLLTGRIRLI